MVLGGGVAANGPLLRRDRLFQLGFVLVALFIWIAENLGTLTKTWLYPHQMVGWSAVSLGKLGSWFLLLIISYTLVSLINAPRDRRANERAPWRSAGTGKGPVEASA